MKIGLGCTTIAPQPNQERVGGISTYTRNLLHYSQQQPGIVTTPCYFRHLYKFTQPPISAPNALTFPLPYLQSLLTSTFMPTSFSKRIEQQIELFHSTDYLIPKFNHVPVVATIHDAAPLKYPNWCNPTLRRVKNWLLKNPIKYVDYVITISQAMIPDLVNYWGIDEKNIGITYLGVDKKWFLTRSSAEKIATLAKYHLNPGYILFAGCFQPRKNLDNILQAYMKLPTAVKTKHHLVLIGNFPWKNLLLENRIRELVSSGHATLLPNVTTDELQILFQCAKLFAFPSLYEGFGLPILEAFASKIPVITSNVFSCPEVAGDAAYLVNPYSIDEISNAMLTLLADEDFCQALITKGYERAQEMTWEKCMMKTIDIYRAILKK
jgi:glycosyltransferase involved in cell wall biosynthesis